MNARDFLEFAGFAVTIAGIVFHAGRTSERFAQSDRRTKEWADGLGKKVRDEGDQAKRRWLDGIATQLEISADRNDLSGVKKLAEQLRRDSWG
jgi:hypothetical protein